MGLRIIYEICAALSGETSNHVHLKFTNAMKTIKRLLFISTIFMLACSTQTREDGNHGDAIAKIYFDEVWNKGRVELLDSLLTPDYINHTPSAPTSPGPAGLKPIVLAIRKAFPDLHFRIEEVITADGYVTIRTVMTGTQKDSLFEMPPTNKYIEVNQINIEKLRDGRIAEHWRVTDELKMMKHLGVIP